LLTYKEFIELQEYGLMSFDERLEIRNREQIKIAVKRKRESERLNH
jgi:hypothetical protein